MRTEAEILADARPGRAFSNSTAYEIWAAGAKGCYSCKHDETGYADDGVWCPPDEYARLVHEELSTVDREKVEA